MTDDAIKQLAALDLSDPRAKDIMAKICIPSSSTKGGKQAGVMPPWKVRYPKSDGKKVSSEEAIRKYRERLAGDGPVYPVDDPEATVNGSTAEDLDPFLTEDTPSKAKKKPKKDVDVAKLTALVEKMLEARAPEPQKQATDKDVLTKYKEKKNVVRLRLSTGVVTMPCLSVMREDYGITVVLDSNSSNFMFVPESGTEVSISWNGQPQIKAYFPGTQFTIPELGLTGLVFVADVNDEKPALQAPVAKSADSLEDQFAFTNG